MDTSSIVELAVISGLTELVRRFVPKKKTDMVLPVFAVLFGVAVHLLLYEYSNMELVKGHVLGLSATGLYKVSKSFKK